MPERPEPFLAERVWAHPTNLAAADVTVTAVLDADGRIVGTRYSDGDEETYTYDERGRVVAIEESPELGLTIAVDPGRTYTGGRLGVAYDDEGPVRIADASGDTVWERAAEPWEQLLRDGAASLAARCVTALIDTGLTPETEVFCMRLIYVADGDLDTIVSVGTEEDRRGLLLTGELFEIACGLWYPESPPVDLAEVESDPRDALLLREVALNDPRESRRTVLTEVAKLLARRDWAGVFTPTEDFVVFVAEHDEGFAPKHASVREVNPPERIAAWDARWPAGASRGEDEDEA